MYMIIQSESFFFLNKSITGYIRTGPGVKKKPNKSCTGLSFNYFLHDLFKTHIHIL